MVPFANEAIGHSSRMLIGVTSYGAMGHVPLPPLELGHVEKFGSFYVHNILSSPGLQ